MAHNTVGEDPICRTEQSLKVQGNINIHLRKLDIILLNKWMKGNFSMNKVWLIG